MLPVIRNQGLQPYLTSLHAMQAFTLQRTTQTADEIWLVEHPATYTLGLNGKPEHLLHATPFPLIASDRGGQITFHAPGQLILYTLFDLKRLNLNIRELVSLLEHSMISALAQYGIKSEAKADAPGVYVADKKIGSVGLRIKKGCAYHGLSLNNHLDLTPFDAINTCGYPDLQVTSLAAEGVSISTEALAIPVISALLKAFNV